MSRQKKAAPNARSVTKPDVEMGRRIRLRRVEMKMSQAELGVKLGVSFQQVQKYEKGVNRLGANRLNAVAKALDVPLSFFFDVPKESVEVDSLLYLDSAFSMRLLRAYNRLDVTVARRFVTLMETVAGEAAAE